MLCDNFGRIVSYLRVSVTDRCNFRCTYCMPEAGVALAPRDEVLSFEEIARVVSVGATLGLQKVRLTGGEPTVRRDLPRLVAMLRDIEGIRELAKTTNAARLGELARPLKDAGLDRLNVSLDTLRRDRMTQIARRDVYDDVMRGIEAAYGAGFPLKFNAVVMRGVNDDEIPTLTCFAHSFDAPMRFIEWMPMGSVGRSVGPMWVSTAQIKARLDAEFELSPDASSDLTDPQSATDPARLWKCRKTGVRVGFISSMTDEFCGTCNRMRLTAEGGLRPCLHQDAEVNVRDLLRSGASDAQLAEAFRAAVTLKWRGHQMTALIPLLSGKNMVSIGG